MVPRSADLTKDDLSTADQTTPLLLAPATDPDPVQNGGLIPTQANGNRTAKRGDYGTESRTVTDEATHEDEEKLPYSQIMLLCYASLADPIAYFAIFPFINEMIYRLGDMPVSSVGFWTGLIESLFSLVQMVLMIFYGRAADTFGRKPVLVFSLAGIGVATTFFGMSQTLWQMILIRCLAGCFSGSIVTIRTMISENCTKKSQARAFSWYMFTSNVGIFIGPVIGGGLANPSNQFPGTFGNSVFFKQYPYALATWVAGAVCLTTAVACQIGLRETLQRNTVTTGKKAAAPMTTWELLKSPGVPAVLFIYGHIMLLGLAYTAVSPVFSFTPIGDGGLSFSAQEIALLFGVSGLSQALWMLLAFPALQKRFGTGNVLRATALSWPLVLASYPLSNEMRRHGLDNLFVMVFWPLLVVGSCVSMGFACVQLAVNDISPSSTVLATLNALALTVKSAVRAFAPVAFTSLFAVGIKLEWADGHLIWVVLVTLGLLLNVAVLFLPKAAEGRYDEPTQPPQREEEARMQDGEGR